MLMLLYLAVRYLAVIVRSYSGASVMRRFFPSMLMVALFATLASCGGGGGGGGGGGSGSGVRVVVSEPAFDPTNYEANGRSEIPNFDTGARGLREPEPDVYTINTRTQAHTAPTPTSDGRTYACLDGPRCEIAVLDGVATVTAGEVSVFFHPTEVMSFRATPTTISEDEDMTPTSTVSIVLNHAVPPTTHGGGPRVFHYTIGGSGITAEDVVGNLTHENNGMLRTITVNPATFIGHRSSAGASTITAMQDIEDEDASETMTVTLTTLPDNAADDPITSSVTPPTITITDDDTRGVTISETALTIDEGSSGTYTVVLNTQPSGDDVTVTPSSNNGDVTFTPASLTFSTANWGAAQTVRVAAGEDDDAANDSATLTHGVSGADYDLLTSVAGVDVTVTDNDVPGVTISETALTIDEGSAGTYTVRLDTRPSGDVTVRPSSNNGDVTFTPASLTFTTANWGTTQTVTVTAGDDDDAANDSATLTHGVSGADYGSVTVAGVDVTVTDDDTRGVTISETALTITEGSTGTYTVRLDTQPGSNVTVRPSSNNGDVTFRPASLTFSTANWNSLQTVTVRAAEDTDSANDTAQLTHSVSGADYGAVAAASVAVTVTDNDTPGISVSRSTLTVGEGSSGTYTVRLTTQPSGSVTVRIARGSGSTDVTFNPTSLLFTTSNWNVTQRVTVRAAEDDDGTSDTAQLTNTASGAGYGAVAAASVTVTVTDNDTRGVTISRSTLTVGEGSSGTYTVRLTTQPSGSVTVRIARGSGSTDVTFSPTPLTFTAANWNVTQGVTVRAAEDDDGTNDTAQLTHSVSGADYGAVTASSVAVTVTDNDTRGVTISRSTLTVGEGSSGTYTVRLTTEPTGPVAVRIARGSGSTDVTFSPTPLTFTAANWNVTQGVTVRAAEDDDGTNDTAQLTHSVSGADYGAVAAASVRVTVTDNDTRGVTISQPTLTITEGSTGTYTVRLTTEPTGPVAVRIARGSGSTDVTTTPTSLTFTAANWNTTQRVTVRAAEDTDSANDTAQLTHSVSGADYGAVTASSVAVTVRDNDTPGISVSRSTLTVGEGSSGTYTVRLTTQPSGSVTVRIARGSGSTDVTATPTSLTFTPSTWGTTQAVTVRAAEDDDAANDTAQLTNTASGADYNAVAAASVTVTVTDNDTRGVTISRSTLTVGEGSSGTYTVRLTTEPTGPVTVRIARGSGSSPDVTFNPTSLTFTASNWNVTQGVTVRAAEDTDSANDTAQLTNTASGADYGAVTAASVTVTVRDNDTPGISVSRSTLTVGEGSSGTYTVRLTTEPTGPVAVRIARGSGSSPDVTFNPTSLTFTTSNWDTTQEVTVRAAEDDDGTSDTAQLTNTASGADYGAVTAASVMVTVTDNDTPGISVSRSTLTVGEGSSGTYTVRLTTQPSGSVTVRIARGSGSTDVTFNPTSLLFTTSNWNVTQRVTVRAAEDDDGTSDTAQLTNTASGADYNAVAAASVMVTVRDNDTRGVTISRSTLTVGEGSSGTYTVRLTTEPTGPVTVRIARGSGSTDVTFNPTSLTFTTSNWDTTQGVTVRAAEDDDAANDTAQLTNTASGADYNAVAAVSVTVTVRDNDTRGVTISETMLTVTEGSNETYTVVLNTQPSSNVTVTIDGFSGTDVTVSPTTLTFTTTTEADMTPSTIQGGWDRPRTVTVTVPDDSVVNPGRRATLTHSVSSADAGYNSLTVASVDVTVMDDDMSPPPSQVMSFVASTVPATNPVAISEQGGRASLTLTLDRPALADLSFPYTITDTIPGTGITAADLASHSVLSGTITVPMGEAVGRDTIAAANDVLDEDTGETMTVSLNTAQLPAGISVAAGIGTDSTEITITDDDDGPITITDINIYPGTSFNARIVDPLNPSRSIDGDRLTVEVILSSRAQDNVRIPVRYRFRSSGRVCYASGVGSRLSCIDVTNRHALQGVVRVRRGLSRGSFGYFLTATENTVPNINVVVCLPTASSQCLFPEAVFTSTNVTESAISFASGVGTGARVDTTVTLSVPSVSGAVCSGLTLVRDGSASTISFVAADVLETLALTQGGGMIWSRTRTITGGAHQVYQINVPQAGRLIVAIDGENAGSDPEGILVDSNGCSVTRFNQDVGGHGNLRNEEFNSDVAAGTYYVVAFDWDPTATSSFRVGASLTAARNTGRENADDAVREQEARLLRQTRALALDSTHRLTGMVGDLVRGRAGAPPDGVSLGSLPDEGDLDDVRSLMRSSLSLQQSMMSESGRRWSLWASTASGGQDAVNAGLEWASDNDRSVSGIAMSFTSASRPFASGAAGLTDTGAWKWPVRWNEDMTIIAPYISRRSDSGEAWATAGFGDGAVHLGGGSAEARADSRLAFFQAGLTWGAVLDGGPRLDIETRATAARRETSAYRLGVYQVPDSGVGVFRLDSETAASWPAALADGTLTPRMSLDLAYDAADLLPGHGRRSADVGAELHWSRGAFSTNIKTSRALSHDTDSRAVSAGVRWGLSRGLALGLDTSRRVTDGVGNAPVHRARLSGQWAF